MFMGTVTCELQLSIQKSDSKQQKYYHINHCIYTLKRGTFGCLTELAVMISQLDPMITACTQPYYVEKHKVIGLVKERRKKQSQEQKKVKDFE